MGTRLVWLKKERKLILLRGVSRRESMRVRLGEAGEIGKQGQIIDGLGGHSKEFQFYSNGKQEF